MTRQAPFLLLGMAAWGCAAQTAHAIPPPAEQFSARCESPAYASDVAVCTDPDLMALDRQVLQWHESWERASASGSMRAPGPDAWVETQDAWFRRRSLCAFSARQAGCLRAAYEERLRVLSILVLNSQPPSGDALLGVCRSAPWGEVEVRVVDSGTGEILVFGAAGEVLAVAVEGTPRDDWTPYLRHESAGSRLRLFPVEGPVVTCELRQPN